MKIKEGLQEEYDEYVRINSKDGYSSAVVTYTERWADLMEAQVDCGCEFKYCVIPEHRVVTQDKIAAIADATSHEADVEGITGFMYGCAVQALARFWEYGDHLRRWHNAQYGQGDDESGGVVNPAILIINTD